MIRLLLKAHYAVVKDTNDFEAPDGLSIVKQRPDGLDDEGRTDRTGCFDWLVVKQPGGHYPHFVTLGAGGGGMSTLEAAVVQESEDLSEEEPFPGQEVCPACQLPKCICVGVDVTNEKDASDA